MVENSPLLTFQHGGLTVEGWSRAAVQTYWRVAELKLGFDLGAHPWDFMATPTWFVTHMHLDHIAAIPAFVARRRMMKMEPPTLYLPAYAVDHVHHWLKMVGRLDRGRLPCELIGLEPGAEVELSRELVVTAHATTHTIPSLGYVVWERRKKLKAEFSHLRGDQIRDLRLQGTDVTDEKRAPLVAYLGDSSPQGLDDCQAMFDAKILLCEMTFVAPNHRREKIHKRGHMHLDDWRDRAARFQNELIVAGHFSTRYENRQIEHYVRRAFPDALGGRLKLCLEPSPQRRPPVPKGDGPGDAPPKRDRS